MRNRRNKEEVSVDGQALLSFYPYFILLVLPHGFVVMGIVGSLSCEGIVVMIYCERV